MAKQTVLIRKGTHAPLRFPVLLIGKKELRYNIRFNANCQYSINPEDQGDINKLFGIGYFPTHKLYSVRIGWRWNIEEEMIQLFCYMRNDGYIQTRNIGLVNVDRWHEMSIKIEPDEHIVEVKGAHFPVYHLMGPTHQYGYLLRPYFGGNQKAPHDMEIDMVELK